MEKETDFENETNFFSNSEKLITLTLKLDQVT